MKTGLFNIFTVLAYLESSAAGARTKERSNERNAFTGSVGKANCKPHVFEGLDGGKSQQRKEIRTFSELAVHRDK